MTSHTFGSRRRALSTAALCTLLAVAALLVGTPSPASAAPASQMMYSNDGGATWSPNATVAPGGTLLARVWYVNDTANDITNSQVTATIPAGWTLVPSSTKVCLSPSTTNLSSSSGGGGEEACSDDAGQDAIDEGVVWTGNDLAISPTAGLFGNPGDQTVGEMEAGRVRYLNLHQCHYSNGSDTFSSYTNTQASAAFLAGTNVANVADTSVSCGNQLGYTVFASHSAVSAVDLLGQRYLNLQQCAYSNGSNSLATAVDTQTSLAFRAGTNASNVADASATCGAGGGGSNLFANHTGSLPLDLLDARYLNLDQCVYSDGADVFSSLIDSQPSPAFAADTTASATAATSATCGNGAGSGKSLLPNHSAVKALDLLDTNNGEGFVQFEIQAPEVTETTEFTMTSSTTGNGIPDLDDTGTLTVDIAVVPLVAPVVGGATVLLAGGGWLAFRKLRRRDGGEPVLVA